MRVIVPRVPPWPGAISDVQWSDVGGMQAEGLRLVGTKPECWPLKNGAEHDTEDHP
jgi:hypothetical protein